MTSSLSSLREEHERKSRRGWVRWVAVAVVFVALAAMWVSWFRAQAERGFARAEALLERGNYEAAREQLRALAALRPDFPVKKRLAEIHDGLGTASLFLHDAEESKRAFAAALALGPKPMLDPKEVCRRLIARGDYGRCRVYWHYLKKWADDAPYLSYYDAYIKNALDLHLAAEGTFEALRDDPEFGEDAKRHLRYIEFKRARGLAIRFLDRQKRTALAEDHGLEVPVVPSSALWPLIGRTEWKDEGMWKLLPAFDRPNRMHLALDLDVQQAASEALGQFAADPKNPFDSPVHGALVALDPASGGILAAASHPDAWRQYMPERKNHAFLSFHPAASTSKPLVAAKALDMGLDVDGLFPHDCKGVLKIEGEGGGEIRCFSPSGRVASLEEAVALSCNTAFARLALLMGGDAAREAWRGAGVAEGIGLEPWTSLALGIMPSPEDTAAPLAATRMALGLPASGSGAGNAVRVSPLYLAMQAAAWAGNGTMPLPYLIAWKGNLLDEPYARRTPAPWRRIASPSAAARMREAMRLAVESERGTARDMRIKGLPVAAKTGSYDDLARGGGWVIGWAPRESPKIAFAVLVNGKGISQRAAVPAARDFLERLQRQGFFDAATDGGVRD